MPEQLSCAAFAAVIRSEQRAEGAEGGEAEPRAPEVSDARRAQRAAGDANGGKLNGILQSALYMEMAS